MRTPEKNACIFFLANYLEEPINQIEIVKETDDEIVLTSNNIKKRNEAWNMMCEDTYAKHRAVYAEAMWIEAKSFLLTKYNQYIASAILNDLDTFIVELDDYPDRLVNGREEFGDRGEYIGLPVEWDTIVNEAM